MCVQYHISLIQGTLSLYHILDINIKHTQRERQNREIIYLLIYRISSVNYSLSELSTIINDQTSINSKLEKKQYLLLMFKNYSKVIYV